MKNLIDNIKATLINDLEKHFDQNDAKVVISISEGINDFVFMFLRQCIKSHSKELISADFLRIHACMEIIIDVMIAPDVWKPEILEIALVLRGFKRAINKPQAIEITITKYGIYKKARIYVDDRSHINIELLTQLISTCFMTAYSWLEEKIKLHIVKEHINITQRAYGCIRTVIPESQHNSRIWLATVFKDRGFHLLNHSILDKSFELIRSNENLDGEDPLRLMLEIITKTLPYEKMLTKLAIQKRDYLEVSLKTASYKNSESTYHKAALAIHGEHVGIYPIIKEGSILLVALFPAELSNFVLLPLKSAKNQISKSYLDSASKISKLVSISKSASIDWPAGKFGEFIGGFIKAMSS